MKVVPLRQTAYLLSNLSYFEMGLRFICNSDIFEKMRPSPWWIFKIPKLKMGHFCFFTLSYFTLPDIILFTGGSGISDNLETA